MMKKGRNVKRGNIYIRNRRCRGRVKLFMNGFPRLDINIIFPYDKSVGLRRKTKVSIRRIKNEFLKSLRRYGFLIVGEK